MMVLELTMPKKNKHNQSALINVALESFPGPLNWQIKTNHIKQPSVLPLHTDCSLHGNLLRLSAAAFAARNLHCKTTGQDCISFQTWQAILEHTIRPPKMPDQQHQGSTIWTAVWKYLPPFFFGEDLGEDCQDFKCHLQRHQFHNFTQGWALSFGSLIWCGLLLGSPNPGWSCSRALQLKLVYPYTPKWMVYAAYSSLERSIQSSWNIVEPVRLSWHSILTRSKFEMDAFFTQSSFDALHAISYISKPKWTICCLEHLFHTQTQLSGQALP